MKQRDISHAVMDKVARFEHERSTRWITIFTATILLLAGGIGIFAYRVYAIMAERQTWDVLEILYEDKEIISEFWQDTLSVALQEVPERATLAVFVLTCLLLGIWAVTRHRRRVVKRRLAELAKRKKNSNNT